MRTSKYSREQIIGFLKQAEQDKRNAVELGEAQVASAMQKTAVAS